MKSIQQGFTLIEMMIVVLVLAILATIAYPSYAHYIRNARLENARADLLTNAQLLERYYAQNHTFPASDASAPFLKDNEYFAISLTAQSASAAARGYLLEAQPTTDNTNETRRLRLSDNGVMVVCDSPYQEENCTIK